MRSVLIPGLQADELNEPVSSVSVVAQYPYPRQSPSLVTPGISALVWSMTTPEIPGSPVRRWPILQDARRVYRSGKIARNGAKGYGVH